MQWRSLLVAALGVVVVTSCGPSEEKVARAGEGERLFEREGCVACHGRDLQGTKMAPPLSRMRWRWSEDDLVDFLANPDGWARRDHRLERLRKRYPASMPGVPHLSAEQRRQLATFLALH